MTSSIIRLWQEMLPETRYNLPMKRNKHVKKTLLVARDGQLRSETQGHRAEPY